MSYNEDTERLKVAQALMSSWCEAKGKKIHLTPDSALDVFECIADLTLSKANGATEKSEQALPMCSITNWALISEYEYPKDEWLLIVTADKAHHVAYYSSTYNKWIANSKFGDKPLWWATLPEPPCL